jgi:hypothetical protein
MNNDPVKITVNKPAADIVFRNSAFVRIRSKNGIVLVCGSRSKDDGALAVEQRQVGGFAFRLEGGEGTRLLELLKPTADHPFFRLERAEGEWFQMRGPASSIARHVPWLRVWPSADTPEIKTPLLSADSLMTAVRAATALVKSRSQGRPTDEVRLAHELLNAFEVEARRMGWVEADIRPIVDAIERLEEHLELLLGQKRTTLLSISRIRAVVRIAEHSEVPTVQDALEKLVTIVHLAEGTTLSADSQESLDQLAKHRGKLRRKTRD